MELRLFVYLSPSQRNPFVQCSKWYLCSFPSVRLCPALVVSVTHGMLQKAHDKEDGLQETHGRANADVRHRTGIY